MGALWFAVPCALAVVVATGLVLRVRRAPYSVGLLTIHKLLAVAAAAGSGYLMWLVRDAGASVAWSAAIVGFALTALAAIATGALVSARAGVRGNALAHAIASYMAAAVWCITFVITLGRVGPG